MKLICPKCSSGVRIGQASRFSNFRCSECQHVFMGLEAEVSWGTIFSLDNLSQTSCPYCWQVTQLYKDSQRGGWYGPPRCCWCARNLPKKPLQNPTEYEGEVSDYESVARTLRGYSCPESEGEQLIRRINALGDSFTAAEAADLRRLVNEAVGRGRVC